VHCHHVHGSLEVKQTNRQAQRCIINASAASTVTTKAVNQASRPFQKLHADCKNAKISTHNHALFVETLFYLGLTKTVFLFVDMQGSRGVCEVGNVAAAAHHAEPLHRAPHHVF